MSEQIPERIKRRFYIYYLKGDLITKICRRVGISRSSSYNLIDDLKKTDPNFPLMRALAVNLKRNGSDLGKYAASLRIHEILEEFGIDQLSGEKLLKEVVVECYKENWKPFDAINAYRTFLESAEQFGHTQQEHINYFRKLRYQDRDLKEEIEERQKVIKKLIEDHKVIKHNLETFLEYDGIRDLDIHRWSEDSKYKQKYEDLKRQLKLYHKGESIDPAEVKKVNDINIVPITEQDILEKIDEIRIHPSLYSTLFMKPLLPNVKPSDRQKKTDQKGGSTPAQTKNFNYVNVGQATTEHKPYRYIETFS
jgi:hypothetical protein